MELLEFLSGKYKDAERIVPGAVQTFQAKEASSGRPVFVHRIPTTGPDAQNGLVRLLSSALLRSEDVRKLVIEVADENGFCYIVTENAEQCLLLREWLQFEVERAGEPQMAQPASIFSAQPASAPSPEQPPAPPGQKVPGEFSRLFHVPPQPASAAPPPPQAPPAPTRGETGEFTRFFRGGTLPPQKPAGPPQRADRPSSSEGFRSPRLSGVVQRPPNAPVTQLPQRSSSDSGEMKRFLGDVRRAPENTAEFKHSASGEFARLFSTPEKTSPSLPQPPPANTGVNAMPAANQEPGEYTRIFGTGNAASPFSAPTPPPQETPEKLFEGAPLPSTGEALPRGPSEYTQIIGRSPFNPLTPAAEPAAAVPPTATTEPAPAAAPAVQIKIPPAPAAPAIPAAPKIAPPKPPTVAVAAPATANQRLVIFLAIIGLLAVALVVAVILLAKK